jgi:hypothetical protein
MCQRKTFCEKHNIERSIKIRSNRNCVEYYCKLCKNERKREKELLSNLVNPDWVAKQNYISNLTDEEKKAIRLEKSKEYAKKYQKTDKRRDYLILNRKCKESNLYCIECNNNRVYGKKICLKCKYHKKFVWENNFISNCLYCKSTFDIKTKLLNKGIFDKINTFCSLKCSKDNIKYNLEIRKENFKNDNKKINKKREWDRFYSAAKRIENPNRIKETIEKYKQSDKYKERVNYYKVKSKEGQCSNIYCIECNDVRLYGDKLCDKCKLIKKYTDAYNFTSVCKHCNQEYGIDKKLNNLGVVHHINNYCSIECNEELKKITKKRNSLLKRKSRNKYNRIRDDKQWAKRYGNKYEYISRSIVYRKHKYICTSCGVKCIHPNKDNYNQSNAATLDHIIPKSKGGSHTYDNVTLLCRSCNTMKSDKILTNYKRNISQMEIEFTGYIAQGSQLQLQLQ